MATNTARSLWGRAGSLRNPSLVRVASTKGSYTVETAQRVRRYSVNPGSMVVDVARKRLGYQRQKTMLERSESTRERRGSIRACACVVHADGAGRRHSPLTVASASRFRRKNPCGADRKSVV